MERLFNCQIVKGASEFDISLHVSFGQIIVEAQPSEGPAGYPTSTVTSMVSRLDVTPDHHCIAKWRARSVRISGGFLHCGAAAPSAREPCQCGQLLVRIDTVVLRSAQHKAVER